MFAGATYLVHRTAISQVLGPNSSLRVSRSDEHGTTWSLLAIMPAINYRDLRDPHFYVIDGKLAIKAITRLPVNSGRDSFVASVSVRTSSPDGGTTWSPLVAIGPETWSFWRVKADTDGMLYSAAYEDGDKSVTLFASPDGVTWTPGAVIYDIAEDTPVETELHRRHRRDGVRGMDGTDDELLGSAAGCVQGVYRRSTVRDVHLRSRATGVRLDGPPESITRSALLDRAQALHRGRESQRTALTSRRLSRLDRARELPSTGDTSYAGVAPIDGDRFRHLLLTNISKTSRGRARCSARLTSGKRRSTSAKL